MGQSQQSGVGRNVTTILQFLDRIPVESASVARHVSPLYIAGYLVDDAAGQKFIGGRLVVM
jgi:hypothetical protein